MDNFKEIYFAAEKELADDLDRRVKCGEITREDADFEFYWKRDEVLYCLGTEHEEEIE